MNEDLSKLKTNEELLEFIENNATFLLEILYKCNQYDIQININNLKLLINQYKNIMLMEKIKNIN